VKRRWVRVGLLLALAAVCTLGGGAIWAGTYWSAPDHRRVGPPPADFPARSIEFDSASGGRLHGWFVPGSGRGGVVLMHGSHETRRAMLGQARFLSGAGYAVLLFDFHPYGESEGGRTTFGYGEALDARAAVAQIRHLAPGQPIASVGFSLGGAASLLGAQPLDVDAMVVEAVYTDIRAAVANRLRMRFGPFGPWLAPLLTLQLYPRWGLHAEQLRPIDGIARVHVPVFVIAGTEDPRAPLAQSKQLFAAAHEPKQFWAVAGAAHVNFSRYAPREYETRLLAFLDRYLRRP
jgi:uncharacterized protein